MPCSLEHVTQLTWNREERVNAAHEATPRDKARSATRSGNWPCQQLPILRAMLHRRRMVSTRHWLGVDIGVRLNSEAKIESLVGPGLVPSDVLARRVR